jgi:hypothetical protein
MSRRHDWNWDAIAMQARTPEGRAVCERNLALAIQSRDNNAAIVAAKQAEVEQAREGLADLESLIDNLERVLRQTAGERAL